MKKVQKQCKRALSMILALTMVVGMLSGCGLGEKPASDPISDTTMAVEEVNEVILNSKGEGTFLLTAGEKPDLEFDTTSGEVTNITVTPADKTLEAYQYYTVTVTLTAKNGESFAKSVTITLDGVELTVKEQSEDKLVAEYTTLALPETITTDEMAKISAYGEAASEIALGTAKVQALLDADLTVYSEDGQTSYIIAKGYVPLFMVPSFVANGEPAQIKDGESVQIISEHGEEDFSGANGAWYKVAYNGKVGYLPTTFVKDAKIQANAAATPAPAATPKKTAQTRPAANPAAGQTVQQTAAADNNDSGSSGSDSGSSGTNNGSSSDNGSGNNTTKTVYYRVDFALGGGISSADAILPSALMVEENFTLDINQLATPSVPGYLFEAWYYDLALTKQVRSGDRINANTTLYAKVTEITGAEVAWGQDNYISKKDVNADNFTITVLKPAGGNSTEKSADVADLHDLADQNTSLSLKISEPESFTADEKNYEKYKISFDELEAGDTYQLQLLDGGYVFYEDGQVQPTVVRLYNFTTAMQEEENLELNSNLIYLPRSEVKYTEGSDYLSGLFTVSVNDDMTQLNTVDGKGSFTYNGTQEIKVGTTVVIYDGKEAPKLGDGVTAADQYDGNAAYVTISKVDGNTYYYGVAEAEDVLFTPDVLPVNVKDDEDNSDTTVTIDTAKLDFSGSEYRDMGLGADTTVDVGDFLAFYAGSMDTATELTYGRITAITVSGEDTILTYEKVSEATVLDSMTVYSTEEMDFELDADAAKAIEEEIEKDAIDSGFALEAANYLATVALATDQLQAIAEERGLQDLTLTREDGSALTQSDLQLMASNSVSVEGLSVKANISRKLENLQGGSQNGVRAQLEVSFNVKIGSGKNQLTLKVAATFEQEIALNLNIKGKTVWGKKWIFYYIKDYSITTNLDVGSYTGVGITATILAEKDEPEFNWSSMGNTLGEQIKNLMETQDKFFNQDIAGTGGGLAEKYANMLENNPDWIDLVNVNIFSNESRILAGIVVVGVQGDFVVSAKVNIMLGMSFQYSVYKRYTFTMNVFSKSSSSNCVDLTKSNYQFDMYVMGTLGLRAGIRLTVYTGLFSKKVACIGITAEAGAYVQMWGYFYYSTRWEAGSSKTSSASGAMLLEVGAYLEIRFLASAFSGRFKYAPVLYDKYWPLWNMGSVDNVYGFNYETTEGEEDDEDINMGANTSVALPVDRLNMSYMNLRNGDTTDKTYTYGDFDITTTGNFKYENGVISVNIPDGSNEEKGTVTLTWKGAPLSFTSKPLSCTLDITWSDPSRVHSVSYDLNGGTAYENGEALTGGIPGETAITGAKLTEPSAELKKEFYVFGGWYQDAAYKIPWNFAKDKVTKNLVLHAKWDPEPYEITYELDGGMNSEANPATYTAEDTVKLADPVKAGYVFLGWYTTADGTGTKVTEIAVGSRGAKTFYALWTPAEQTYEIHHMLQTVDGTGYEDTETVKATALTATEVMVGAEQSKTYTGFTYDATKTEDNKGIIPAEGTLVLKLYYSRNIYDVTFVSGTDVGTWKVSVPYQGKVEEPQEPSKTGYDFTGWYTIGETSGIWNFETDVVTDTTELRAGWLARTYNVTFDLQGGSGGDTAVQATYDSAMPMITVPARVGYQFAGYYDQAEGGTKYYNADGSSAAIWNKTGNATLYAQWIINNYQVTFDANGGSGSMDAEDFVYGETKQLSTNSFTKTGYAFAGWATTAGAGEEEYKDGESVSNLTVEPDGVVTLYAVWKPIAYQVVFEGNGADSGSMENQQMIYDAETALNQVGYEKKGYHLLGWATTADAKKVVYENRENVKNLADTQDKTVTLYAVWGANTYQVEFHANGGEGTMEPQSFVYDEAAKALSENLYSRDGYIFLGWASTDTTKTVEFTDKQQVQNLVTEQGGVMDLYAVWKAMNFTVSFDANEGNTTATSQRVTNGTPYGTLPDATRTGYTFAGWYTEKDGGTAITEDTTVDIAEDITLYAHWTALKFTVSFDSNKGEGSSEPTKVNDIKVTYDSTYTGLPTPSREGYYFYGWYTEKDGGTKVDRNTKVSLLEDQTLYAQWRAASYSITFNTNAGTYTDNTTDSKITQTYDSEYQLPEDIPTRPGYNFAGWYTAKAAGEQVTADTKMTTAKDHTLYAQWVNAIGTATSVTVGGVTLTYSGEPVYARTSSTGTVTIGGSETDYNIKFEDGVLYLKAATISVGKTIEGRSAAIYAVGNLKIIVDGDNGSKVTNTNSNDETVEWNCGVYVKGDLTITHNGRAGFTVKAGEGKNSYGVGVEKGIFIMDHGYTYAYGGNATGGEGYSSCGYYGQWGIEMRNESSVGAFGGTSNGNSYGMACGTENNAKIIVIHSSGNAKSGTITSGTGIARASSAWPDVFDASLSGTTFWYQSEAIWRADGNNW